MRAVLQALIMRVMITLDVYVMHVEFKQESTSSNKLYLEA